MRSVFAVGCVVCAGAFALSAPVPKNAKKTDYFPLAVGTKWEYVEGDDVKTTEVIAAAADKEHKDATLVTLTYVGAKSPPPTARRVFRVVNDDIFSLSTENAVAEKAGLIMKRMIRANDAWSTEHQWKDGELWTIANKVGESKSIKTPAGEFTALPVVQDNSRSGKETRWYAAGIGLVRKESDGKVVSELKSFTPGK